MPIFKSSPSLLNSAKGLPDDAKRRLRAVLSLSAGAIVLTAGLSAGAQTIPADAQPTATVPAPMFASWFQSGHPSLNGVVNPANSVTFSNNPSLKNVDFYQWSYQMFLWLTSPAPSSYGGGSRIFSSPTFYDVSPINAAGNRVFIPHVNGKLRNFNVRISQLGPHGLPTVTAKDGTVFEVDKTKVAPSGRQLILNSAGKQVEVGSFKIGANKKPTFLDKAGKLISQAKAILRAGLHPKLTVQRFVSNKKVVFLTTAGDPIDTGVGQAGDSGVLIAQNGSLVYYETIVNDVYAYFLSGTKGGGITPAPTQFPTTQTQLNQVTAFAATKGKTFPDPNALAVEIKAAWVNAAGLPNLSQYITTQAFIPTFTKTSSTTWTQNPGSQKVTLALVGLHVVGSVSGHPEMVWSTFEHFGNTPNAQYTYVSTSGITKTVSQSTAGSWLFCASGASGTFNNEIQSVNASGNIVSNNGTTAIGPSNVLRFMPWGASNNQTPNPLVSSLTTSNTQLISINNSVRGQLPSGDVRGQYFMTGSTWTEGGQPPNTSFPTGIDVGTSQLSNTTMETFTVTTSSFNASGSNCFRCHTSNTVTVSHVYQRLIPLP